MVLPGGGILENVLIMQIAFVVLIAVLLIVCALKLQHITTGFWNRWKNSDKNWRSWKKSRV